jgi:SAM-dependent methyltransferase
MSYLSVPGHRAMALDARRNEAYGAALRKAVGPESVVLDLGAGTGIHGLMAARLGAKRVYLVESEDIIAVAVEIAADNGFLNTVQCLQGRIQDVRLPERVDVIVSVLTGNFLLTEDLLPALFHARKTALKPGGVLIPCAATMEAVPVSAPDVHAKEIATWSLPHHGIDMNPARTYAANSIFYRTQELRDLTYLAEPLALYTLDFYKDEYATVHIDVTHEITQSGVCHGWLGWFSMKLGDHWLSTSPREQALHWSSAFLPLDPPIVFEQGERVSFVLDRVPFGDWTWTVRSSTLSQRHSTMLSAPIKVTTLKKLAVDYAPCLNAEGAALVDVLGRCDGSAAVSTIAESLHDRYPERYPTVAEALGFVQDLVKRYA